MKAESNMDTNLAVDVSSSDSSANTESLSFTQTVGFGFLMGVLATLITISVTSFILYKTGIVLYV